MLVRDLFKNKNFREKNNVQVRMNFSHGSYEYHQSVIDNTRKMVAGEVFADTSGVFPDSFFAS
jgi:pyruvate kinase